MSEIYLKILTYAAAVLLVFGVLYGAYQHGVSTEAATWKTAWNERDARDAKAKEQSEVAERAKEQGRQQALNKVIQNAQTLIETSASDLAAANHEFDSLHRSADALAKRITVSQTSGHSCTTATSEAASRAVVVFSQLLKRADQRAGDLARFADESHSRGVTCEKAYGILDE